MTSVLKWGLEQVWLIQAFLSRVSQARPQARLIRVHPGLYTSLEFPGLLQAYEACQNQLNADVGSGKYCPHVPELILYYVGIVLPKEDSLLANLVRLLSLYVVTSLS